MRNISVFLDSNAIIVLRIENFKIGLICPVFGTYYIILYSCKQGGNPKKILQRKNKNEILYDTYQRTKQSEQFANSDEGRQNRIRAHQPYAQSVITTTVLVAVHGFVFVPVRANFHSYLFIYFFREARHP